MTDYHGEIIIEGMTSVSALINAVNSGVNDRKIHRVYISRSAADKKIREIAFIKANSHKLGYKVEITSPEQMDTLTAGTTHGGIAALCSGRTFSKICPEQLPNDGIFAFIDGIEDPFNYAYTVRSLYAAGFDGIVLPPRNWANASGTVIKSSAGTSELMPTYVDDPTSAVNAFRSAGYKIVCAGIRDSVSLFEAELKAPLLLIIGGEKRGISRSLLSLSDMTVRIDYGRPFMGSLTTAASASVIAFEIMRQNR